MADEYYKGVKLLKGKNPRKNYFQQKALFAQELWVLKHKKN